MEFRYTNYENTGAEMKRVQIYEGGKVKVWQETFISFSGMSDGIEKAFIQTDYNMIGNCRVVAFRSGIQGLSQVSILNKNL